MSDLINDNIEMNEQEELLLREAVNRTLADNTPDIDAEWDRFITSKRQEIDIPKHRRRRMMIAAAVAAILVIVAGMAGLYGGMVMNSNPLLATVAKHKNADSLTVTAPDGQKCQIQLPDGTKIWLSAGTTVKYPATFSRTERSISLQGEAFFDVTKDPDHPFVVNTPYLVTKVFGTQFNIRCYTAKDCHVTLVTGSIEVTPIVNKTVETKNSVVLTPGNDVCITEQGTTEVKAIAAAEHLSWQDGTFNFDDVALGSVLDELGVWYHAPVVCSNHDVMSKKIHINLDRNLSLDQAVELINSLGVAEVTINNGNININ